MAWGGARAGSGPKKRRASVERPNAAKVLVKPTPPLVVPATPKLDMNAPAISPAALAQFLPQLEEISKSYAVHKARSSERNPFQLPVFPKAAIPPDDTHSNMAMDSFPGFADAGSAWLAGAEIGGIAAEGMLFMGYSYLAELAQRPEFRVISETIADDATRKWIDFDVVGDSTDQADQKRREENDPEGEAERKADPDQKKKRLLRAGKMDKVKAIQDDQLRMGTKDAFYQQARNDGFFGRSHLFMDIRANPDVENADDELTQDIGNGRTELSKSKCPKGGFVGHRTIEAMWTYPLAYNANNPLRADWYNPQTWYVLGKAIHSSRIPTFIGHPVPDMLKPAYAFGGLSLTQMAKPYVDIWLQTRESVAAIIHSFSVMVLMTDLSTMMQPGNASALLARVAMFNMLRDNQGTFVVNKNTEDFKNVSASLAGLHELQAQSQEHMASVSRIPLVKLLGIQPAGLNASSEGEIKVYDDTIAAYQSRFMEPNLSRVINFQQLSLFGDVDPQLTWHFEQLREMTQAEKGQKEKDDAERDDKYVTMGALAAQEVRARIIDDPELPYADLDPDDLPDPPEPEGGGFEDDEEGGDRDRRPSNDNYGGKPRKAAGADALDPFFGAQDSEWNEADHTRGQPGNAGQFGPGGGSSSTGKIPGNSMFSAPAKGPRNFGRMISKTGLKKVGAQMGSNAGGVFEDSEGREFYIKEGKSPDHVKNELIAAALYGVAGTPTLKYHPVEGGGHIATRMSKLDKKNANDFSNRERAEAKKDFAVHAWLGNWDAAGTGGDNLGVVKGMPTALDVGGALEYRAQGAPKGKAFGDKVTELDSLRDKNINRDTHKLFGDMTPAEMRESARYVTSISDKKIRGTVESLGGSPKLADKLIARRDDIARQAATFGAHGDPEKADSAVVFAAGDRLPVKELNGIKFKAWTPPRDWARVDGQAEIDEPEFHVPQGKTASSGVIMREPDGRVWIVRPSNGYGGYEHTFPKGGVERGLSLQANAIKEAFEESGLKAKIVGHAGDMTGDATHTRYYYAERETGDPAQHEEETDGVALVPAKDLDGFLNRTRDKKIGASLATDESPKWDESKHPRAPDGKFGSGGGSSEGGESEEKGEKHDIGKLLHKTPIAGSNYRKALAWALKQEGLLDIHKKKLAENLMASWQKTGANAVAKGDFDTAKKIGSKIDAIGKQYGISSEPGKLENAAKKPTDVFSSMPKEAQESVLAGKEEAGLAALKKGNIIDADEIAKSIVAQGGKPTKLQAAIKQAATEKIVEFEKQDADAAAAKKAAIAEGVKKMTDMVDALIGGKPNEKVAAANALAESITAATAKNTTPPTAAELAKAEKTVALQKQYATNLPQSGPFSTISDQLVKDFNEKYADKKMTTPDQLNEKVSDFKTLNDMGATLTKMQTAVEGKIAAEAKLKAQKDAVAAAEKAKKEAAKKAEANAAIMKELGISDQQAEAVVTLAGMLGKSEGDLVSSFKSYAKKAEGYGYPITGFQAALISNYSNGGYASTNTALRSGAWTPAQHQYVSMVNKALQAMPTYTGTVRRGTSLTPEQIASYKPGHIIQEHALMSTSTGSGFGGEVRFTINAIGKRGASIKKLSQHSHEDEVLFAAKTFFKVDKVEKSGGHTHIHMTEWDEHL